MMWVCKLSYGRLIALKRTDGEFYHSIIRGMNQGLLLRLKPRRLKDIFRISIHDDGLLIRLHPISDGSCLIAGKFLESKYGLLQLHEVLCDRKFDEGSLADIIIPSFDRSFEEEMRFMMLEASEDSEHKRALDRYVIRSIERYVEEKAGVG